MVDCYIFLSERNILLFKDFVYLLNAWLIVAYVYRCASLSAPAVDCCFSFLWFLLHWALNTKVLTYCWREHSPTAELASPVDCYVFCLPINDKILDNGSTSISRHILFVSSPSSSLTYV